MLRVRGRQPAVGEHGEGLHTEVDADHRIRPGQRQRRWPGPPVFSARPFRPDPTSVTTSPAANPSLVAPCTTRATWIFWVSKTLRLIGNLPVTQPK